MATTTYYWQFEDVFVNGAAAFSYAHTLGPVGRDNDGVAFEIHSAGGAEFAVIEAT